MFYNDLPLDGATATEFFARLATSFGDVPPIAAARGARAAALRGSWGAADWAAAASVVHQGSGRPSWTPYQLTDLCIAQLLLDATFSEAGTKLGLPPEAVAVRLAAASLSYRVSQDQLEVAHHLEVLGIKNVQVEANVGHGGLSVDMYVPGRAGGPGLVVECHGPQHYCCNEGYYSVEARSRWKGVVLRAQGFAVLVVPYYEWDALDTWNRTPYLRGKLVGIGWLS